MTIKKSIKSSGRAFKKDLALGNKIEQRILAKIQKKYPSAVLIPGKFKKYDIFIPENDSKVEVKVDYKSQETGNILIELRMFNKPSGLLTTEADFWIIYTGTEYLWTEPRMILECIMINNIPSQKILGKGDEVTKDACLIPIDIFKKYLTTTYI